eukprot:gb/GECH01004704.1/.p1 GENE.gb/GECH01004704.1/~~gb/GECH01004704.1/.p1  ORF type:complete len:441 (+),score=101.60 gb/GECH01004704.1/:1-1323(+)
MVEVSFQHIADMLSQNSRKHVGEQEVTVDSILFSGVDRVRSSVLYRECKNLENVSNMDELRETLNQSMANLSELDTFEEANVMIDSGQTPNGAQVVFHLKEKNPFQINADFENNTKSKSKLAFGLELANRLGFAERFNIRASSTPYLGDPEFDIYTSIPHVGINSGNIEARAYNSRGRYEQMSNVAEVKNGFRFTHRFRNLTSVIFNGFFRNIKDYDNVKFNTSDTVISSCGESSVTSVTLRHLFPFVDDLSDPQNGFVAAMSNEVALPPGDTHFWKNRTAGSLYWKIGRYMGVSLTGYAGVALPLLGATSIGIGERFFTENMVRGFKGAYWGPKEEDDYVGGNVILGGMAALRFFLAGPLRAHIFANAANVANMSGSDFYDPDKLTHMIKGSLGSVGAGLALTVGAGVLEFNFSQPLQGEDQHFQPWKIHIAFSPSQFV